MKQETRTVAEFPEFNVVALLADAETLAAYVTESLKEDGAPELLLPRLHELAQARGLAGVARAAGMTAAELGEALQSDGDPSLAAIQRILAALGLQLSCQPARPGRTRRR